ncbi:MAG: RNA-binding S4 domain-containing protein [Bacilli bacterium]
MRLDKYLKVSRIIKRRTVAKEVCDQGRIQINGATAKASTEVKVGDELCIRFGNKDVYVTVTSVQSHASKEDAKAMFELIREEKRADEHAFES